MRTKAPEAPNVARNIVVRSFRCLSSEEPDEYFCEGLVEEIIHAMTKIRHLRVFPIETVRGSRNAGLNVRELSEKLGVEAVLDGNVRKRLNKLRVAAHLTNAADGSVTWSEMYERDIEDNFATQVFAIQEQIAHSIVDALWLGSDLALPGLAALHFGPGISFTFSAGAHGCILSHRYCGSGVLRVLYIHLSGRQGSAGTQPERRLKRRNDLGQLSCPKLRDSILAVKR